MSGFVGKKRFGFPGIRELLLPVFFFVALTAFLLWGTGNISLTMEREQLRSAEQAVRRTVAQCYALEGRYPQSVGYLTEHYGLAIDPAQYIIHYEWLGANLMPQVTVFPLAQQQ